MSFEFLYITSDIAQSKFVIAQGVDFIFVDMEYIGKAERQPGDTVKNRHTPNDILQIRESCNPKKLLARINPYGGHSQDEIESAISAGATHIMLPMINSNEAIIGAANAINGRAALVPLIETIYSLKNLEQIITSQICSATYWWWNQLKFECVASIISQLNTNKKKYFQQEVAHD